MLVRASEDGRIRHVIVESYVTRTFAFLFSSIGDEERVAQATPAGPIACS